MKKYLAFVRLGFAGASAEPTELYARVLFLLLILGVFSALWRAVEASGGHVGGDPNTFVWYLAATEWVLMSAPHIHFRIEDDVRRGDVAYQLVRPASYLGAHFAEGVGAYAARALVMLVAACAGAWMFAGAPVNPPAVGRALAFGCLGSLVVMTYNIGLGLTAFWLGDIAPVYWIWQKLTFVLGGLLLPLTVYPDWVIRIARATPFSAVLAGPASFVLGRPVFGSGALALALVGWASLAGLMVTAAFRVATKRLQLNGG
jgi:ABC-2 type transport system permease protein